MTQPRQRPRRSTRVVAAAMQPLERRVMLASAFIDPPALPTVFLNTTYTPGTGATIIVPAGGNLQSAINSAQLGDTIVLAAGATFSDNYELPNKTTGSGWITIRTSTPDSALPAPGTRVTPAHAPLMAKISSPNSAYAISTTNSAHHYRFIGIEFTIGASVASNTGIVVLGSGSESNTSLIPNNLIFDRCYIHGNATGNIQNGMRLNSASTAVIDSYFDQCQATTLAGSFESHNIGGYNGPGPYKLVNNTFSGACIPVIFGGATTSINGMIPSDIEIRNNYFTRPRSWRPGDPSYVANNWYVKNLFELKNAQRVLFDGNILEHNWPQAGSTMDGSNQAGYAILLTVRDQIGVMTWATVQDVTLTNNIIRKSNVGISIYGTEGAGTQRVKIENNLFDDIGLNWDNDLTSSGNDRTGMFVQFQTVGDTIFNHNTIINDGDIMFANGDEVADVDFTNNIVNHNAARTINFNRGINGPGTGIGVPTLDAKFVQYLVTKNVMANQSGGTYTGAAAGNFFPGSSATPGNFSSVGFSSLTNRDYRLAAASAYNNAATDGTDIGANIDTLEAAAGGAMTLVQTGTTGNDTYYVKRNGQLIEIYNNATGTGTPILRDMYVYYESLSFDTGDGTDTIIFDYSGGSPIPTGGVNYEGGAGSSDVVRVIGNATAAVYTGLAATQGAISLAGAILKFNNIETVDASSLSLLTVVPPLQASNLDISTQSGKNRLFTGLAGPTFPTLTTTAAVPLVIDAASNEAAGGSVDAIVINALAGTSVRFIGGGGNDTMAVNGSSLTFNTDLGADSSALSLTVASPAAATFGATQRLRSLTVNGQATMTAHGSRALATKSLTISGGKLNLNDNDLIVDYTGATAIGSWNGSAYTGVTGMIQTGSNGGAWDGNGLVTAMSNVGDGSTRTLGVGEASAVLGIDAAETAIYNGVTVDGSSVIVKYTYLGDIDLSGEINGDDYFFIDSNVINSGSVFGYAAGDVNLDGEINGDDYFWLDSQIVSQGAPL
jgi:hypothetical protein